MMLTRKWFRKKEKVPAKIISWIECKSGSYPVFEFTTKEGEKICGMLSETEILPIEALPIEESKKTWMREHLPATGLMVTYDMEEPHMYTGAYAL